MIDVQIAIKQLKKSDWFYNIPSNYHYFEALENEFNIEEVLEWLKRQSFGKLFLANFFEENRVEISGYLETLELSGDTVQDAEYRSKLVLNYFADTLARERINGKFDLPEWLEFTVLL